MLIVKIEKYVGLAGDTVIVEQNGKMVERYTTTNVDKMLKLIEEDYGKINKIIDKRVGKQLTLCYNKNVPRIKIVAVPFLIF